MNQVVEEMKAILDGETDVLMHYGTPRHSGRYPWGSGDEPYQRGMDFLARYEALRKQDKSDVDIAKELNMLNDKGEPSTGILRLEKKYANDMRRIHQIQTAKSLKEDGLGATEIGRRMGINESSVRTLLDPNAEERTRLATNTANFLREQVDKKGMIDISTGVELDLQQYDISRNLNISGERLKEAVYILQKEGYEVYSGGIPQPTNAGQQTTQKVLCVPGTKHSEIYQYDKVHTITEYTSHDGGNTFDSMVYPKSMDSKRLKVLLGDEIGPDGERGVDKDGIIQIRRGVEDLSLGDSKYSQVRILVDGNKYLKGMAVYSDNMPDGIDVIFNSNKTSVDKALKDIKTEDPLNPFGSAIKPGGQSYYIDKDGNRQLSLINKRADEGDWSDWTDALPSQFLSKQPLHLVNKQLGLAKADKQAEFEEICALTNPTVKKHFLNKFADECDAAAVDLKAAALPGQKYHVIIPVNTLKDNEIYAPQYPPGTRLALVRYPHAGQFEIPIVKVTDKNETARKIIGTDSIDAVGINKKIAERLSGADFDGDTVMCIPTHDKNGRVKIHNQDELEGLKGFDPQVKYAKRPGMKYMKDPVTGKDATQTEMGKISNLITDMTLFGAPPEDMEKAVRHSMVVIDAGKHQLDYKRSETENDIALLKKRWQQHVKPDGSIKYGGAATIISKSKGEETVDKRQGTPKVNIKGKSWYDPNRPEGALIYKTADDLYYPDRTYSKKTGLTTVRTVDGKKITYNAKDKNERDKYEPIEIVDKKTGEIRYTNKAGDIEYRAKKRTQASMRMAETDDAMTLVSPSRHPTEIAYAEYANSMKAMANKARLEAYSTQDIAYNKKAKDVYREEAASLTAKLNNTELNSIRERAALRKANVEIDAQKKANPNMKKDDLKKLKQRATTTARSEVGAIARRDRNINITDREWEAIQAGAISKTQLTKILNNTDTAKLRERAMPKSTTKITTAKANRIKRMRDSNYTIEQIANALGVSPSSVSDVLKGVS